MQIGRRLTRAPVAARLALFILAIYAILWSVPRDALSGDSDSRIAVIVSSKWQNLDSVSIQDLRQIYLGRLSRLGGVRVRPCDYRRHTPVRATFLRRVLKMAPREFDRVRIELQIEGLGTPLLRFNSFTGTVAHVSRRAGAIGYVDADSLRRVRPAGIKTLAVVEHGQRFGVLDPGYPLQSMLEDAATGGP